MVPSAFLRVSHEKFTVGDLSLRLSYAFPLSEGPPKGILFCLDPEPELFSLATSHLFGRYGYDSDPGPALRGLAVVGVGHHPDLFTSRARGWDIDALRELRRRDFLREAQGGNRSTNMSFLAALCEHVVPHAEAYLGLTDGCPRNRRVILGCSLSGLVCLRALFEYPSVFGR